jgi:hypothetical protein
MGTNTSILTAVGALLQDLKMPGFHLTLGHSASAETGADWDTMIEVPALVRRPDVHVDGEPVMVRGRYSRAITA